MKKKLILGLGLIVAVAAITAGVTYAVFHYQTPSVVNVMTAGNVQIELIEQQRDGKGGLEAFEQGKKITPIIGSAQLDAKDAFGMPMVDNYQDKIISVKNTGANEAYVRVLMAVPSSLDNIGSADGALHVNFGNRVALNGDYNEEYANNWKENWHWDYSTDAVQVEINGVKYNVYSYMFKDVLESGVQTSAAIAGVYLDHNVEYKNGAYYLGETELEGFDGIVTIPVLAQAVQADGYSGYKAAFDDAFPFTEENLEKWFTNANFVTAAPAENAVRPSGYTPAGTNVVVDGITVIDNSDDKTNLRALYTGDGKKVVGNLTVTNSYLDGTYAMNVIGDDTGVLTVLNTALRGWVSYDGFESATFTDVTFGANTNPEIYNVIRPYSTVTFTNCDFDGTEFWLDKVPAGSEVKFVNCTMNGEVIDDVTDLSIPYGDENLVVIANS